MIQTKVLLASEEAIAEAVGLLQEGQVIAFPTDTVYGVGAHALQEEAVARLYVVKDRPRERAIPVLLAQPADLTLVAREVSEAAWRLGERFWPGGLTIVVSCRPALPQVLTAGKDSVAVRVPDHPITRQIIAALGAPLAATSANISGQPPPVTAGEVLAQLGGRIPLILDGGPCPGGIPSTVLDLTVDPPRMLRPGPVSAAEIAAVLGVTPLS